MAFCFLPARQCDSLIEFSETSKSPLREPRDGMACESQTLVTRPPMHRRAFRTEFLVAKNPEEHRFQSVKHVTVVAGFLKMVVYTQRRVPDTEKDNGYKEED
jgi:hypothetical protein